jgi:uncharacterized protein (TIGR03067 family)
MIHWSSGEYTVKAHFLLVMAASLSIAADNSELLKPGKNDAKEDAVNKDRSKLQGTWTCQSAQRDGKPVPEGTVKQLRLVLTKDKYATHKGEELLFESEYKIDPEKKPKEIDIIATEGENKGKPARGIYLLEEDTLKLCYTMPGKERPKEFESKAGTGATFAVWKRSKP